MISLIIFTLAFILRIFLPTLTGATPAVFLGALTVVTTYFLIREAQVERAESIARLSALLLAINPWHILVSREFILGDGLLLAVTLGLWFFFHFEGKKKVRKTAVALTGIIFGGVFLKESLSFHSLTEIADRYGAPFSGQFLFFAGDWFGLNKAAAYQGAMYDLDIVFLLWGLGYLISKKRDRFENLILYWLLLAPLPAIFFPEKPLSLASFGLVIPLVFLVAQGVDRLFWSLRKKPLWAKVSTQLFLWSGYGFCLIRFVDLIFNHR
ncbi:MAG TPA: hypothetical protein VMW25_00630 [Clostridia bacterium]|nr:hypothetical protein [Clostridia bacterium]